MRLRSPNAVLLLALGTFAAGAAENTGMLTSVDSLASRLGDPNLVILHVGMAKDFELGRIPGSKLVTLADLSITGPAGLRLEMPPVEQLRDMLLRLGVADGKQVVIYPGNESVQSATRVWFTLDYLGWANRVSLLDGGLGAWKRSGRKLEAGSFDPTPKTAPEGAKLTTLKPNPHLIVDAAWLKERLDKPGKIRLIDARTPEFYTGASNSGMPRAGRIPGAVNVPFPTLVNTAEDRKLLPASDLRSKIAGKGDIVAYCHIGQQATVVYFAARYLGLKPKLYDGSFQDWSSRPSLPVAKD